jgi:hypothetical protein
LEVYYALRNPPGSADLLIGKTTNETSNIEYSISNVQVKPPPWPRPGGQASPSRGREMSLAIRGKRKEQ